MAPTPAAAPREGAEFVFACVGNDDDLRAVALGDGGAFAGMDAGRGLRRPHHGLGRASRASWPAAARERGLGFVDAPVSGGQAGAENGTLTVMCGGDAGRLPRAEPVIARLCAHVPPARRRPAPASSPRW